MGRLKSHFSSGISEPTTKKNHQKKKKEDSANHVIKLFKKIDPSL